MSAKTRLWLFPTAILFAWLSWVIAVILHGNGANVTSFFGVTKTDYKIAAEFGDAFGSLSSLMAALAAAGAWHAVAQTRIQAFESTFYSLLAHHNQIVGATDIQAKRRVENVGEKSELVNGEKYVGRDAYKRLLRNLRLAVAGQKHSDPKIRAIEGYKSFYNKYQDDLAHYFRTIYHIMRYIDNSSVPDKNFYARVVRAQLSNSEQILLMYNCSVGKGRAKFRDLVERYALLHNMSVDQNEKHWEITVIKPSIRANAFREDETEQWPEPADLALDEAPKSIQRTYKEHRCWFCWKNDEFN